MIRFPLILEGLRDVLVDCLAPHHRRQIVHAPVDVVRLDVLLPLASAIASRTTPVRRAAPARLHLATHRASIHLSAIHITLGPSPVTRLIKSWATMLPTACFNMFENKMTLR